ncbi:RHS repeat domain-containing protein [Actinoplanes octamycinicus]|nr:RHS repeat-associated core domain-containing protein [Actinoplanes octamycinicus]
MLGQQPAIAADPPRSDIPKPVEVAGLRVEPVHAAAAAQAASTQPATARRSSWPTAGTTTVDLAAGSAAGPVKLRRPTNAAVARNRSVTPDKASLTVHDRKVTERAGVDGVLLSVKQQTRADSTAPMSIEVDYSSFADAVGGDWASRLRLVRLPACVLTTPEKPACQTVTEVPTTNNAQARVLSAASVASDNSGTTVLAAESGSSGDNGDYKATDLTSASTWQVTDQTGGFNWSYPLRVPDGPGGMKPSLSLSYSSQSVDGLTAATNNQGGWVGDGWSMWPGFIERKYASCADDDSDHKTNDQCWFNSNATLSMNGHAGELVRDTSAPESGEVWRLKNDDGTVVRRRTDRTTGNGDDNDEFWQVTTTDGTQYYFGYHRLPNWSAGKTATNSTWTVPVYGNDDGEPCHKTSGFSDSYCDQAWRWNLDYVVEPHGNTMAYFYQSEKGAYGREKPDKRASYDRGGYLDRIEYGMRQNAEYSEAAPLRVVFGTKERCDSDCWKGEAWTSDPVKSNWPDTPWDQYCKESPCNDQPAATFWSARRLTSITTQIRNGTSSYADVETVKLRQRFLSAGTGEGIPLWLDGITRTGQVIRAGGTIESDPEIVFDPGSLPLDNRVDAVNDQRSALARWRIKSVLNESGGKTLITYSEHDCTRANLPDPKSNTTRCMPAFYTFAGETKLDWFHKYVVTRIDLDDVVTDQPDQTYFYDYLDKPAWHYIDDEIIKKKYRTWGEWRGYSHVRVRTGSPTGRQTAVERYYMRGMDGDYLTKDSSRDISIEGRWGGPIKDQEALQGFVREVTTFDGPGGKEISTTVNDPWMRGPTATRVGGDHPTKAWMTLVGTTRSRTALAAGGYRTTKTVKKYNNNGLTISADDSGDDAVSGDEICTRTTYTPNAAIGMVDRVSQVERLSLACTAAPATAAPATVLSRTRTFYDTYSGEASFGRAPTKGDPVREERLEKFVDNVPSYIATSKTYDPVGRVLSETNGRNFTTRTQYNTANGGLLMGTTVTNPLGHQVISTREPAWDVATKLTDANGLVTEMAYDGLGRMINVWLPGRSRITDKSSLQFGYDLRNSGNPTAVTTRTLLPTGTGYRTSVVLYDGFLRQRQSQAQTTGGGRLLTDTLYNETGDIDWTSEGYYDTTNAAPDTTLGRPEGQIPSITQHVYDGAGREVASIFKALGAEKWRTTTSYGGDRTTIVPPSGGTATTEITDVRGNMTALRQYRDRAWAGSTDTTKYDETLYTYTLTGQRKTVVDTKKNTWTNTYDLLDREVKTVDPDTGTNNTSYDADGNVATTTTPLGTLAFTYDELDRKTSMRDNSISGTVRADWVYDKTPLGDSGTAFAKGKLTSSTRYVKSPTDATQTLAYTARTDKYDVYTRPVSNSVVVPSADTTLCAAASTNACTYTTQLTYKVNGQVATMTLPQAGDLAQEKLTYGYNDIGEAGTLYSAGQVYVDSVTYNKLGQLTQRVLGDSSLNKHVAITSTFDEPTRRLTSTNVVPFSKQEAVDYTYRYDDAGNVVEVSDTPENQQSDIQCYQYDYLRRMTSAWTPAADDCAAAPSYTSLGGSAAYWRQWTYDEMGNRTTEVLKAASGDTTYKYTTPTPGPGSVRPHAVTSVTATGAKSFTKTYGYDGAGNTNSRPAPTTGNQTLDWNIEGSLEKVTEGTATTSYVYDADGERLLRSDPNGSKTLYLDNGTELRFDKPTNTKKATRFYTHADRVIAVRSGGVLSWIAGDHHGTAEVTINASTLTVSKRRTTPFGEFRGASIGIWPTGMDKGMVGGTVDPIGLTHLDAREYDPFLGRFISVDPEIDVSDPQTMHGYLYSNNNPATYSDPTGRSWGTFFKVVAVVAVVVAVVAVAVVAGPALIAAAPAIASVVEVGATTAMMTGSASAAATAAGTAVVGEAAIAGGSAMAWGSGAAALTTLGVAGRIMSGSSRTSTPAPRTANQLPKGGNGVVLSDGHGATAAEIKLSVGPKGESVSTAIRNRMLSKDVNADGVSYDCWRCGWRFWDKSLVQGGHRNAAEKNGGLANDYNICAEGWACNSSAQNRGRPSPGMSCWERYTACNNGTATKRQQIPADKDRPAGAQGNPNQPRPSGGGGSGGGGAGSGSNIPTSVLIARGT